MLLFVPLSLAEICSLDIGELESGSEIIDDGGEKDIEPVTDTPSRRKKPEKPGARHTANTPDTSPATEKHAQGDPREESASKKRKLATLDPETPGPATPGPATPAKSAGEAVDPGQGYTPVSSRKGTLKPSPAANRSTSAGTSKRHW